MSELVIIPPNRCRLHSLIGNFCLTILILLLVLETSLTCQSTSPSDNVSGEYYDWTKTLKPERPWIRDYNQTFVMKLSL